MRRGGESTRKGPWLALPCVLLLGGCQGIDYVRIVRVSCEAGAAKAEIETKIGPEKEKAPLLGPFPVDTTTGTN